jgi:flagellar motor switch protein FliN/FliY
MGDMLSQAEIDALLNGTPLDSTPRDAEIDDNDLTSQEIDALGEIGNISMGTSATTLFTLIGQKVTITTPKVSVCTWENVLQDYPESFVGVKVEYTKGLIGTNLLIISEEDVKIITDIMMGGTGINVNGNISELHLSAISEAMNQMVGSSSTSMSSMFDKRIDISPPKAFTLDEQNISQTLHIDQKEKVVKIEFKMVVGTIIDSKIMQILPISFAKALVSNLLNMEPDSGKMEILENNANDTLDQHIPAQQQVSVQQQIPVQQHIPVQQKPPQQMSYQQPMAQPGGSDYGMGYRNEAAGANAYSAPKQVREPVNVQPVHFQDFDDNKITLERNNIGLIMDVPLQVTVELGRTQKMIKEILEFSPGSIIELDKLAGDPVDILVNGKPIAKGEVVVIDESFGVRITDIIHPSKRL